MAKVVKGMLQISGDLDEYLKSIEVIPDKIQDEMLKAMSDVVVEGTKKMATEMLTADGGFGASGKYTDVKRGVISSIKMGRIKKSNKTGMRYTDVIFKGKQHGERLAAIAFMNEYGVVHKPSPYYNRFYVQPPRPFVSRALLYYGDRALKAAENVLFKKFLKI